MLIIFNLVFFLLGILCFFRNKDNYPYYYLLWLTVFPYFISFIIPMDIDDIYMSNRFCNMNLLTLTIFSWVIKPKPTYNKKLLYTYLLIFIVLIVLAIYHSTSVTSYLNGWRTTLQFVFLFVFCSLNRCQLKNFMHFVVLFLTSEILLCIMQFFISNSLIASFATEQNGIFDSLTGTLERSNSIADLLGLLAVILLAKYNEYSKERKVRVIMFNILVLFVIAISGIRGPLISLFVVIVLFVLAGIHSRKTIMLFMIALLMCIFCFSRFSISNSDTIQRQIDGLTTFSEDGVNDETSTVFMSTILLTEYFPYSPVFGSGLFYKSNGYGGFITTESNNESDVTLALFLTEYGLLFIALVSFFYYQLFFQGEDKRTKRCLFYPFVYLILLSVVDLGIVSQINITCVVLFYFHLKHPQTSLSILNRDNSFV